MCQNRSVFLLRRVHSRCKWHSNNSSHYLHLKWNASLSIRQLNQKGLCKYCFSLDLSRRKTCTCLGADCPNYLRSTVTLQLQKCSLWDSCTVPSCQPRISYRLYTLLDKSHKIHSIVSTPPASVHEPEPEPGRLGDPMVKFNLVEILTATSMD